MIIRVSKRERYVMIEKTGLEDSRLSFKAKGIRDYLLSKPDDWTVNYRQLAKVGPDKQAAILSGLNELIDAGYLQREKKQNSDGTFVWEQVLYESPMRGKPTRGQSGSVIHAWKTHAYTEEGLTDKGARTRKKTKTREPRISKEERQKNKERLASLISGIGVEDI